MDASEIVTGRFLAGFEQRAGAKLPKGWKEVRPEDGKLRRSAAVLLEVAERPTLDEMALRLAEIAQRVAEREGRQRPSRDGDEAAGERGGKLAESALWGEVRRLLGRLAEAQPGARAKDLFGLEICRGERWVGSLARSVLAAGFEPPPATAEALAAMGRILLRAKARQWSDEDRQHERGMAQAQAAEGDR